MREKKFNNYHLFNAYKNIDNAIRSESFFPGEYLSTLAKLCMDLAHTLNQKEFSLLFDLLFRINIKPNQMTQMLVVLQQNAMNPELKFTSQSISIIFRALTGIPEPVEGKWRELTNVLALEGVEICDTFDAFSIASIFQTVTEHMDLHGESSMDLLIFLAQRTLDEVLPFNESGKKIIIKAVQKIIAIDPSWQPMLDQFQEKYELKTDNSSEISMEQRAEPEKQELVISDYALYKIFVELRTCFYEVRETAFLNEVLQKLFEKVYELRNVITLKDIDVIGSLLVQFPESPLQNSIIEILRLSWQSIKSAEIPEKNLPVAAEKKELVISDYLLYLIFSDLRKTFNETGSISESTLSALSGRIIAIQDALIPKDIIVLGKFLKKLPSSEILDGIFSVLRERAEIIAPEMEIFPKKMQTKDLAFCDRSLYEIYTNIRFALLDGEPIEDSLLDILKTRVVELENKLGFKDISALSYLISVYFNHREILQPAVTALFRRSSKIIDTFPPNTIAGVSRLLTLQRDGTIFEPLGKMLCYRATNPDLEMNSNELTMVFILLLKGKYADDQLSALLIKKAIAIQDFEPFEIALIFNHIANYDHPDNPSFKPLFMTLNRQIVASYSEFESRSIAKIYHCIGKASNLNSPFWEAPLAFLMERAIEIADQFESREIAMVFVLIFQMDNANSFVWEIFLEKIRERALSIYREFSSQGISIAFELMYKLNRQKSPEWKPLLTALTEQAVSIPSEDFSCSEIITLLRVLASTDDRNNLEWKTLVEKLGKRTIDIGKEFSLEQVALLHDTITLFQDSGNPFWQEVLDKLRIPIINDWKEFLSQKNKFCTIFSRSDNKGGLLDFMLKQDLSHAQLSKLGAVSAHPGAYFVDSNLSRKIAVDFLASFWANSEHLRETVSSQNQKYLNLTPIPEQQASSPSCISFVTAELQGKPYCFISTSIADGSILKTLDKHTRQYNYDQNKDIQFLFVNNNIQHFNQLMQLLTYTSQTQNKCAEKRYTLLLIGLFLQYGSHLQVTGLSNCHLYPWQKNKQYGFSGESIDPYTSPTPFHDSKDIGEISINFIKCCTKCTENKHSMLFLMRAAQEYGIEFGTAKTRNQEPEEVINHSLLLKQFDKEIHTVSVTRHSLFNNKSSSGESSPPLSRMADMQNNGRK